MISIATFGKNEKIPSNLQANANLTIAVVNEIFAQIPEAKFRFTSGYRSPARNKAVGGVPNSYHLTALAADFVPTAGTAKQYEARVKAICAKYGFEVLYHSVTSGLHFHIEPAPKKKTTSRRK